MILTIEPVFTVWAKSEFLNVLFRSCTLQWLDEGGGGGGGGGGKEALYAYTKKLKKRSSLLYTPTEKLRLVGRLT